MGSHSDWGKWKIENSYFQMWSWILLSIWDISLFPFAFPFPFSFPEEASSASSVSATWSPSALYYFTYISLNQHMIVCLKLALLVWSYAGQFLIFVVDFGWSGNALKSRCFSSIPWVNTKNISLPGPSPGYGSAAIQVWWLHSYGIIL